MNVLMGGYPEKLSGEALSLHARMGAVCDVYDAITSERCYKKGWEPAEAIRKMASWKNGHFDETILHAFVKTVLIRLSPNDCSRGCFWPESGVWSRFREQNVGHTDIGLRKNGLLWDTWHSLGANRISTVKTIGIYPNGTLLRLKSGHLGVVTEQSSKNLTTPRVKVFFSIRANAHIPVEVIDMAKSADVIVAVEDPQHWRLDLSKVRDF